ncbi:MAG: hypothetical protein HKO59_07595 [Phycisphaerales bacterium]|nr:hypothetical protein [Phycisphaerales bacterium]
MRYTIPVILSAALLLGCSTMTADERLMDFATKGDLDGVRAALSAGAAVDFEIDGMTVLMGACTRPDLHLDPTAEVVRLLLDNGAKIDAVNSFGETALAICSKGGADAETIRILNGSGAS